MDPDPDYNFIYPSRIIFLRMGYRSNGVAGNLPGPHLKYISVFPAFLLLFFPFVSFFCLLFKSNEGFSPGLQGPVFLQFFLSLFKILFFLHLRNKYLSFLFFRTTTTTSVLISDIRGFNIYILSSDFS